LLSAAEMNVCRVNFRGRMPVARMAVPVLLDEPFLVDRAPGRRREEERFVGRVERGGHGAEHGDDSGITV